MPVHIRVVFSKLPIFGVVLVLRLQTFLIGGGGGGEGVEGVVLNDLIHVLLVG